MGGGSSSESSGGSKVHNPKHLVPSKKTWMIYPWLRQRKSKDNLYLVVGKRYGRMKELSGTKHRALDLDLLNLLNATAINNQKKHKSIALYPSSNITGMTFF